MRLNRLSINNLIIIEQAEVEFGQLTVFTGETGAGKTVFTRAFDLLAGKPSSKDIGNYGKEVYVESCWQITNQERDQFSFQDILEEDEEELILARKVSPKRSQSFIGGRTCSNKLLKDTLAKLIQLYGQYEQQNLSLQNQQSLIDQNLETTVLFEDYYQLRKEYRELYQSLVQQREKIIVGLRTKDLLEFEVEELDKLGEIQEDEEEHLLKKLSYYTNIKDKSDVLQQSKNNLEALLQQTEHLLSLNKQLGQNSIIENTKASLNAFHNLQLELETLHNQWEYNEEEEQQISQRLETIYHLSRKYSITPGELSGQQKKLQSDLLDLEQQQQEYRANKQTLKTLEASLLKKAQILHQERRKKLKLWRKTIESQMEALALKGGQIDIQFQEREGKDMFEKAGIAGLYNMKLVYRASPELDWGEIEKNASGGERSRLMLLLKLRQEGQVILMDEPDTGVGGNTAHSIADKILELAQEQQVIIISHLYQLAIKADTHYVVEKQFEQGATKTKIKKLCTRHERIEELCRMNGIKSEAWYQEMDNLLL